jgi:hypothetical protein
MLLSWRVVCFSNDQSFWQCYTRFETEDGELYNPIIKGERLSLCNAALPSFSEVRASSDPAKL